MTVLRASVLGYCAGVRRAMRMAFEAIEKYPKGNTYTYGPLIHNPTALASLEQAGIHGLPIGAPLSPPDAGTIDVIIVCAHGVAPEVMRRLGATGAAIVDATCPRVTASQQKAARFAGQGCRVIIAGDRHHGEVAGIAGYAKDWVIVENAGDAARLDLDPAARYALIAQTTISREEYAGIKTALTAGITGVEIAETLCPEAVRRQDAVQNLCGQVAGVLVIGGRDSANTRRLFALAAAHAPEAALIEGPDEIPARFFALDRVGLTAGASTPDEVIDAVEVRLKKSKI
ncbi:MAG: 4-hydroxy-3-methylbut-2-enyl diphosphate reductase [Spirochaetaceae bacterium]|jgi:4-hydroxy-3-methylbut-2-enyl diphosphate reductase|nr:4-hydroxy-3-methylbut-2-enyl diphosphate reductase [Spirochaetaceae bacterium]